MGTLHTIISCIPLGVDWRKEKNFIQKNGNPMYGGEYFDGQQNTFQIHVRNDVDESIKFREVAPAIGPVVVVPKDVTAKVDYIDKDRYCHFSGCLCYLKRSESCPPCHTLSFYGLDGKTDELAQNGLYKVPKTLII